jgi:hypothetical protein
MLGATSSQNEHAANLTDGSSWRVASLRAGSRERMTDAAPSQGLVLHTFTREQFDISSQNSGSERPYAGDFYDSGADEDPSAAEVHATVHKRGWRRSRDASRTKR